MMLLLYCVNFLIALAQEDVDGRWTVLCVAKTVEVVGLGNE